MLKPQKALHLYQELEKKRTKVREDTFIIFEKYDGWYGLKEVSQGGDKFPLITSRARRAIPSLVDLSRSMAKLEADNSFIDGTLIFEILVKGSPLFKDLNGILNRSKAPCQASNAYVIVHDYIPTEGLYMPFNERYELARAYVSRLNHSAVQIAPIMGHGTADAVQYHAEQVWARGGEGAIGKNAYAGYSEGKRNKDIIKVKCEVTVENVCVGYEPGTGKYAGTLGSITVRSKAGVENNLSGMSDEERDRWWSNPLLIVGRVVEIDAMQILANGSFREGRFKAIRYDKDVSEID